MAKEAALRLLAHVRRDCDVRLLKAKRLPNGWVGSFEAPNRITIANRPDWVELLAHEYGHYQQDRRGLFRTYDSTAKGYRAQHEVLACELDAERRAWRILRRFKALKDPDQYRRRANEYIAAQAFKVRLGPIGPFKKPDWHAHSHQVFPGDRWMALDEPLTQQQIQVLVECW